MAPELERDDLRLPVFGSVMGLASPCACAAAHPALPRGRRVLLGLMLLACSLALALAPRAEAAGRSLLIEGAGDGHGVGMSQDGALGFARHGASYQAILAHYYTGTTIGQAPARAVVRVLVGTKVVRVPLERYVRGVVAAEMPASWPLAALEAQAVASRTYALASHAGGSRFDVYSDTRSQVYLGVAAETSRSNQAVADTAGQVVLYAGKPATTYFFASSGGMTENIENSFIGSAPEPWLVAVVDPYEEARSSAWRVTLSFASVAARLNGLLKGSFRGIEVLRRGVSPRVVSALVLGSRGDLTVSGPELAQRLGLTSTWAYFSVRDGTTVTGEPDRSGRPAGGSAAPAPTPAPASTPVGPQGGAIAPSPAPPPGEPAAGGVAAG
ncbi:MAG TPA: SpoIID/LytB domain-containing protein [Solirubrobacteraceae bacterium]|nr:SpoIID/LytB domain-containing protein [Solirubrobacteraceae bacterium]